jgi:hypothetical protein
MSTCYIVHIVEICVCYRLTEMSIPVYLIRLFFVRVEIHTVVTMESTIFGGVMPCSLVVVY